MKRNPEVFHSESLDSLDATHGGITAEAPYFYQNIWMSPDIHALFTVIAIPTQYLLIENTIQHAYA
jgi:hypothetical protein